MENYVSLDAQYLYQWTLMKGLIYNLTCPHPRHPSPSPSPVTPPLPTPPPPPPFLRVTSDVNCSSFQGTGSFLLPSENI